MSEELKPCEHGRNFCMDCHYPKGKFKTLPAMYDGLAAENQRLRTELAALKAGQGEAVYQLPSHARGDKWYGFGYVDFSSREDLSRLADYLKDLLDDVPETPLYTAPPASADAVSVSVELLKELIDAAEYGTGINNSELMQARALLAQSE